jgi:hypothetical protein
MFPPKLTAKPLFFDYDPTAYATLRRMVNSSPFATAGFVGPWLAVGQF